MLEPLTTFGERGWRDERTWPWLKRLRGENLALWCTFVDGYSDRRAAPLLEAVIDAHASALDDMQHLADDDRIVVEALEARLSLDAPGAVDVERLARLNAWRVSLPPLG